MSNNITPQDLGSSLSVMEFLRQYAIDNDNLEMRTEVDRLISDYNEVIEEPDISDKVLLPYNRKDAYSILEYLKLQAEQLSEGRWTDFSDADIGTVYLKLMSYLSDMVNFQVDKTASELFLSTCTERVSALYLCSLIGYEPRHYQSAYCDITLINTATTDIPNGTIIPAYSIFTNASNSIKYCNLEEAYFYNNEANFTVYEGTPVTYTYTISNISTLGRIVLQDYNIGTNTISLSINGIKYNLVDDVRLRNSGGYEFSVHMYEDNYLYIQLPSYWPDFITQGSVIEVKYLLSNGINGRIGKNILTKSEKLAIENFPRIKVASNTATEGGYDPESIDEMKISVPRRARTMNTIVTINDFEEVSLNVIGISDVSALDYNDPSSGLIQPDDYYKVYMYVLPDAEQYDATDTEALKYRNTIIKKEEDWEISDLENVAENLDTFAKSSITGSQLILEESTNFYTIDNIVPAINTGVEETSYLIEHVSDVSDVSDRLVYSISSSDLGFIINFNSNWKDFVNDTDIINIYYKREQILTDKGQRLREYVDERRLTSLNVTYHEIEIVHPKIVVDIYMDQYDIRFKTIDVAVKDFILDKYSRKYLKIGDPIFASVIGSDILKEFNYIRYCEVREPEELIEVLPRGFIDVVPNILNEEGELEDLIIVNVHDYQNRII